MGAGDLIGGEPQEIADGNDLADHMKVLFKLQDLRVSYFGDASEDFDAMDPDKVFDSDSGKIHDEDALTANSRR